MKKQSGISGILPVLKEPGPTSHDVVQMARRVLHQKQIGHTGTLDPAAAGLLVLCLGTYTKLVPYLVDNDKTYRGYFAFGIETDMDDSEGTPTLIGDAGSLTGETLRAAAARYTGEIEQLPPRYSAVKIAGKKLYEYAREGKPVAIEPRRVTVRSLELADPEPMDPPSAVLGRATDAAMREAAAGCAGKLRKAAFRTRVSSGTYVRSLARDIGRQLGCGGYLLSLERDGAGVFSAAQAMPIRELLEKPEAADDYIVRGAAVIDAAKYPVLRILTAYVQRLHRGQPLTDRMMENPAVAAAVPAEGLCVVADDAGGLLAIMRAERFDSMRQANPYDSRCDVHFRPVRIFPGGLR